MASGSARDAKWRRVRREVLDRDGWTCQLRLPDICTDVATCVDHVLPQSVWPEGRYVMSNLVSACRKCNRAKSNKVDWRPPEDPQRWL